jgi:hypothetical protein
MRIKKHPSGNEYTICDGIWIRNFTKNSHTPLQLSPMFAKEDYDIVLRNEEMNRNYPKISDEKLICNKVVIVSDGYDFENRHKFLQKLDKSVTILAVNRVLPKWTLYSNGPDRRAINAVVINNPYQEAFLSMPGNITYFPACIASMRTNYEFLKKYRGDVYTYCSTPDQTFGVTRKESYFIDDYRNPICAALALAYRFYAKKIMFVCCDDAFKERRDTSVLLENGLYVYPQQLKSYSIIDANLGWIMREKDNDVIVADYSSGPKYKNATYISSEDEALNFFKEETNST